MALKYIKVEYKGSEILVLFPEFVEHIDIANKFGGVEKVLSAGFCAVKDEYAICMGKSISIHKKSDEQEDTKILKRMLA